MSLDENQTNTVSDPGRREFFSKLTSFFMIGTIVAAYGYFASMAGRFLYPARPRKKQWLFVRELSRFKEGESLKFVAPDGSSIAVAKQGSAGGLQDFVALSSTCPHLGCQVHWEGQNQRFFCPCHNGAFDPKGQPTEGPPKEANQSLSKYPLKIDNGMLFIEVPVEKLNQGVQSLGHRPTAMGGH